MSEHTNTLVSSRISTAAERREKRSKWEKSKNVIDDAGLLSTTRPTNANEVVSDNKFADLLKRNEDDLLAFVAQVNHVYQEKLNKDAPFMTFMLCGMQSAGKSTIMERFMNAVLNIVQEGTGTRCPLDTTCIHDDKCLEPECSLHGSELDEPGANLSVQDVFERITEHNRKLGYEDRFSTEPLRLVYKARNVQNMRFVDTPGIISTKGTGKDNREDIKRILKNEMGKANTKLCVLLEPKEFATNDIINFCDETFGDREAWIENATFLMTKFDKQLEDSRTGSKANNFFSMFHENGCFPHLVITPTLPKEDLPPDELYEARMELLRSADAEEKNRFEEWRTGHERFRQGDPTDKVLSKELTSRIGFKSAKTVMREIMLADTVKRLPEVLAELRKELSLLVKERKVLEDKMKFSNPAELKAIVGTILYEIEKRLLSYLDGDIESALKFPDQLQTLEQEIDDEDSSDWTDRALNHHSEMEDVWRERISNLDCDYPADVQPHRKFLGGKQVHRAIDFFKWIMISSLPDPFELKGIVGNGTGFLGGGLQRENWERATVQVVRVCVKKVSHPGINFLIKHIGSIFRRLFSLALEDVKQGEELSSTFRLLPTAVEKHFLKEFDDLLWTLLLNVASVSHASLEPMYSSIDPSLPTFNSVRHENDSSEARYVLDGDGNFVLAKSKKEQNEESWYSAMQSRFGAILSGSGADAKEILKKESRERARNKTHFLPDERTAMVTDEELDQILRRAFEYILALLEFNLVITRFQITHYLYEGFKTTLGKTFKNKLMNEANWAELIEPDPSLLERLQVVNGRIDGVQSSLMEVERLQRKL